MFVFYVWLLVGILLGFIAILVLIGLIRSRRRLHDHLDKWKPNTNELSGQALSDAIRERRRQHTTQIDQGKSNASQDDGSPGAIYEQAVVKFRGEGIGVGPTIYSASSVFGVPCVLLRGPTPFTSARSVTSLMAPSGVRLVPPRPLTRPGSPWPGPPV